MSTANGQHIGRNASIDMGSFARIAFVGKFGTMNESNPGIARTYFWHTGILGLVRSQESRLSCTLHWSPLSATNLHVIKTAGALKMVMNHCRGMFVPYLMRSHASSCVGFGLPPNSSHFPSTNRPKLTSASTIHRYYGAFLHYLLRITPRTTFELYLSYKGRCLLAMKVLV